MLNFGRVPAGRLWARAAIAAWLLTLAVTPACTQTLAKKGWAGSGLSAQSWWRSAVFYRIAPEGFQDSDGDGLGDLRGVSQRMDYLHSLGIDAVVLQTPFADAGFDDLLGEASRHHIRLLVELHSAEGDGIVPAARQWLTRGVAGVWLTTARGEPSPGSAALVHALRTLTDSFPGERVLVEDSTDDPTGLPPAGAQLVARALPAGSVSGSDAVTLRLGIEQARNVPPGSVPLLLLLHGGANAVDPLDPHVLEQHKILAAALLATHGPVSLEYGQEIGLARAANGGGARPMQWTPSNITRSQVETAVPIERPGTAQPQRQDTYGAYVPYVPPEDRPKQPVPLKADFNALPGFTTGKLPISADASSAVWNVASEDADPNSLLSFYRKLSQLHHDNPAFREGSSYTLNDDAEGVLLWIINAQANSRSGPMIVAACNLTGKRVAVPLWSDFGRHNLRLAEIRPLVTSSAVNAQADQTTRAVMLAPWSVFVGQVEK